jgi:hypothetical protein
LLIRRDAKVSIEGRQDGKQIQATGNEIKTEQSIKNFSEIYLIPAYIPKGKVLCQSDLEEISRPNVYK